MKIAVCSLSQFAYVSEFVQVAQRLQQQHQVRYYLGFPTQRAVELLEQMQVPYSVLLEKRLDMESNLTLPASAASTYDLFKAGFVKQAELSLPYLLQALNAWQPDLVLSYLRDYAGMTAAEVLGVPMASFGSLPSPVRIEGVDPPFGAGVSKDAPKRLIQMMWQVQREFHSRLDPYYNATIRQPYGLDDVHQVSTLHSHKLVILGTIPILSNKNSPDPLYVKYVGPLFSGVGAPPDVDETELIASIASSPKPRVFVTLGTTYAGALVDKCLAALADFPGSVIVTAESQIADSISPLLDRANVFWRPFFSSFDKVLELSDAVVTVVAAKTVLNALGAAKPLVCLPQQGEQYERAHRLQTLGAAEVPCPRRWDAQRFAAVTEQVATQPQYHDAAALLKTHVELSGGVDEAARLIEGLSREPDA